MQTQKQVWNNIAQEWNKFKITPAEHVFQFLRKQKGNVLDLGSGSGRHLKKIPNGTMYLVDFSEKMIKLAKKKAKEKRIKAEFAVCDITEEKLPFQDNFFDSAIAVAFFHCIPKKFHLKTAKELFRVLKKGAEAEISVWNKEARRFRNAKKEKYVGWRDKGKRYYYLFTTEEIYKLFEKAGFVIKRKEIPQRMISFVVRKP